MSTHPGAMTEAADKLNAQLLTAISEYDAHKVEVAIQRGAAANGAHLPLHAAMRALGKCDDASKLDIVAKLIQFGALPNGYPDPHGALPLTLAAQIKNAAVAAAACELLVKAGADLERGDGQARRALHWAAITGNARLVAYLLDCGAEIDAAVYTPGSIGCQYLDPRLAAQAAQAEAGRAAGGGMFGMHGMDGDEKGDGGGGDTEGSDSDGGDSEGAEGNEEAAGGTDTQGGDAVPEAQEEATPPKHHAFLAGVPATGWAPGRVKQGADGKPLTVLGTTPLAWAVRRKRNDVAKMLILRGAFLDSFDGTGGTPLMIAARGKNAPMVRMLRHAGARDCVVDTRSMQELLGASYNPRLGTGISKRLVSRWQIAVLSTQSGLFSALQCAVQQRSPEIQRDILHTHVADIPWPLLRQISVLQAARMTHSFAPYMDDSGLELLQLGTRPAWQGSYCGARRQLVLKRTRMRRDAQLL